MAVMARRRRRGLGSDGTQPVVTGEEQSVVDPGEKAKQEEEEQRRRREEQEKAKELRRKERAARDAEEDNRLRELRHKRREAEEAACLQRERQAAVREQIRFAREAAEAELRAAKSEDAEESTGAGQNSEQQQQQESVCQEASALEVETSPGNNNNSNSNNNNQDAAPQKLADRASNNNNNDDDDNSAHPDPAKSAASAVVESPGEDLAAAAEEKLRKKRQQEADVAEKKREAELQRKNKKESEEKAAKAKKLASETVATEESDVLKSQVNVAVLGHEGAGKTSLCAAILHASGALNDRDLAKFRKELAAGLVEGEEVRREEGAQTRSARLTLLDVPGSRRCLPQAVQAAAEADVALVVVSAKGRELEGALKDTGGGTSSLLEQLRIASGLGARRLLVAVTKMDEVKWAQDRFAAVVALLTPLLEHTGFKQDQVAFVPVSGLSAELDCKKAPWHTSGKLLDCLDAATSSCESRSGPLRVLVFEASKGTSGGLKVLGRVEQGVAAKGQSCVLSIGQLPCVIEAVTAGNVHSPSLLEARGGDTVELQLSGGPWAELPPGAWRGAVLAGAEAPVRAVSRFKASMDVLENPKIPMTAGFKCVLHLHAATVEAEILKIVDSTDLKSGAVVEKPKVVRAGQRLTVLLELSREVALELPAASEAPGRLALLVLRSGETTVAIGHAIDLPRAEKCLTMRSTEALKIGTSQPPELKLSSSQPLPGNMWLAVNGDVYDMSKFGKMHPGGVTLAQLVKVLEELAGRDVTTEFYELHRHEVLAKYARLKPSMPISRLRVGRLDSASAQAVNQSFKGVPFAEIPAFQGQMSPYYGESHKRFTEAVQDFVNNELVPIAATQDLSGSYPDRELQMKLGQKGLMVTRMGPGPWMRDAKEMGIEIPGGVEPQEFDYFHEAWLYVSTFDSLGAGWLISAPAIYHFGSEEMKRTIGSQLLKGEKWSCLAISEPFAGSDVAAIKATARKTPDGKHYVVNGIKKWITEGAYADYFVTAVRTGSPGSGGISMLLIERTEAMNTSQIKTTYSTCCGTSLVVLNDVLVPVSNLLGKENEGFKLIMYNFNHERWMICQSLLGQMRAALADTFMWSRQRKVFGKPLIDQPVIRNKLASSAAAMEAVQAFSEALTYDMMHSKDGPIGQRMAGPIAMLKYQTTRTAWHVADDTVQILGGRGITRTGMGAKVEGLKNFAKYAAVYGGSEEIMADLAIKQDKGLRRTVLAGAASAPGRVPLAALLLDKGFRRTVLAEAASATPSSSSSGIATGYPTTAADVAERDAGHCAIVGGVGQSVPGAFLRLLQAARDVRTSVSFEESPRASVSLPFAQGISLPDARSADHVDTGSRNVKGELLAVICRRLGRPVGRGEVSFEARLVAESPPAFEAQVEFWGRIFKTRQQHPNKKAAEQEAALAALEELLQEDSGTPARASPEVSEDIPQTDFKGQLLGWLQARGVRQAPQFEVERCEPEESQEKSFLCRVLLPDTLGVVLAGRCFVSAPQTRSAHGESAKARRAAEQDAARVALLSLEGPGQRISGGKDERAGVAQEDLEAGGPALAVTGPALAVRKLQVLRIPADSGVLPRVETLLVDGNDFLAAVATALTCRDVAAHPLNWLGNRPKGLCLYEAVSDDRCPPNARASQIASTVVRGDAFLMDASAHSGGALLVDYTGARYEALKADRLGLSRSPAAALNASRGMLVGGHPLLPESYHAESWVGQNPKTLLNEVVKRLGHSEVLRFQIMPDEGDTSGISTQTRYRATVALPSSITSSEVQGNIRDSKMDAQQDAALAALRRLELLQDTASASEHPLASSALADLVAKETGMAAPAQGTQVSLNYDFSVVTDPQHELTIETGRQLTATVGARVLHPALEKLLGARLDAAWACPEERELACHYEGVSCTLRVRLQVCKTVAPTKAPTVSAQLVFDPPLWRQRQGFIVRTLLGHGIRSVLDLGCGEGQLMEALLAAGMTRVLGVDHSGRRVKSARRRLQEVSPEEQQRAEVVEADFLQLGADADKEEVQNQWVTKAEGIEAVVLCEVLEHLPAVSMPRLPISLLGAVRPRLAIVSSPNSEFSEQRVAEETPEEDQHMRHPDHEREWSRAEFRDWAQAAAAEHGYVVVELSGVGLLPDHEDQGPCTQMAVFLRLEARIGGTAGSAEEDVQAAPGSMAPQVDVQEMVANALRSEELRSESGLWKYVHREGVGEPPVQHSRVTMHYATYLSSGRLVNVSREGRRSAPSAFQLGGQQAMEAWQLAAASMRRGELAWLRSPPNFAYGPGGAPPLIPAGEDLWFALELMDFRLPATLQCFTELVPAMQEAEKHMEVGRSELRREAFAQARQAFRRALAAVPEKLLLGQPVAEAVRFAALERASLLNQMLCSQRLGQTAEEEKLQKEHWQDVLKVCDLLFRRHDKGAQSSAPDAPPENMPALAAAIRAASTSETASPWLAKAHFRRGLAREQLGYLTDAVADFAAALRIEPGDSAVAKRLEALRQRQQRVDLKPTQMFAGILERERLEREREAAAAELAVRKQRKEERLRRLNLRPSGE
ncbi:unnamed protein product [Polarella glacialis]|uniref:peptidylprolyl isomerase n=1 Tax=Polarella glacialis TaxID=89957 RepID=A0A813H4C2_POLGL|nr:unnamed protein product [Polarella glacialis]